MNTLIQFISENYINDEKKTENYINDEIIQKSPKFVLTSKFQGENELDVVLNKKNEVIIEKSDYEVINGVYKKHIIINGKQSWFKKAGQSYDEEIGFYIYLADKQLNKWVISNGGIFIYECINNPILY